MRLKCKNSDYSFLKTVNFEKVNPADIKKLGPGAFYYFYHIFKKIGDNSHAVQMLTTGIVHEQGVWQELCYLLLTDHFFANNQYAEAERTSLVFLEKHKQTGISSQVKKHYIEALYWQQKDEETLKFSAALFPGTDQDNSDPELSLFKAVTLYRLGKPGWKEQFVRLFLENKSSLLHSRAYRFLENQNALEQFSGQEKSLLQAKHLLVLGKVDEAIPLFKYVIEGFTPDFLTNSTICYELGIAYLNAGKFTEGITYFSALKTKFTGNNLLTIQEMTGRLYRKVRNEYPGLEPLKAVFTVTSDRNQKDRALWFYLDIIANSLPEQFIKEVMLWAEEWQDADYFADLLNQEISYLVSRRQWENLRKLYIFLKPIGPESIILRLSYILSRALDLEFLTSQEEDKKITRDELLQPVHYMQGIDYYSFLSGVVSGKIPTLFNNEKKNARDQKPQPIAQLDNQIMGFFEYGLISEGIKLASENIKVLSRETVIRTVKEQYFRQEYKQGISLMMKFVYPESSTFLPGDLEYLFPVFFSTIIDAAAKKEGLAPYLLYALIYKESAFDNSVISPAGAIGLTQLLPDTAQDMANLLKLKEPDLRLPETNIALGAKYLGKLVNLLESVPKALLAYNGGLTRVRRWEKEFADFPPDLLIETVPYEETRVFTQRVMEIAVMYGYLYYNKTYTEIIKVFFPEQF